VDEDLLEDVLAGCEGGELVVRLDVVCSMEDAMEIVEAE